MLTVVHGDNYVLARKKLGELIDVAKEKQTRVIGLEAKRLTLAELQDALGGDSLFGEPKCVVIEELHSLPVSARKKSLIELVSAQAKMNEADSPTQVILLEKKLLTATMLKKFAGAQIFSYKVSNSLWEFLDKLGQKNSNELIASLKLAIEQNDDFFVFTMIIRQVRMLIQAKDNGRLTGAPFMITKLKNQANRFTLDKLILIHGLLFKIDLEQKTSTSPLTLTQELDLLMLKL